MGVCCSAGLGVFKFVVDYWCRYQVLCSFVVKMPRPHGNCKFRNEWLAIDKFKDWVARDRADDKSRQESRWRWRNVRWPRCRCVYFMESHVWSAQHQRCERAASSSVVNVLAPQSRVAVPAVLYWQWHLQLHYSSHPVYIDRHRATGLEMWNGNVFDWQVCQK